MPMNRSLLLSSLFLSLLLGCGDARTEVAKDKVLAQVDRLLGEIDVKKKEVEIGVHKMDEALDTLRKGKIDAKVRLAKTDERIAELEQKLTLADSALGRLRDYLQQDGDVEINGKAFTVPQLKEMADKAISARKKLDREAEGLKASQKRLQEVVRILESREAEGSERLATLKLNLSEIDSKAVALKSMQEAASLTGDSGKIDFDGIEKQVRDLSTKIDVELAFQDEKSQSLVSNEQRLETIIKETSTASDTLTEIDHLLGAK